ncbi:FAS1-like dehydratase domain-containing protein [Pseudomonas japonica]|uniref:Itaconyl-CoA hydratase / mesaconyl-C4 CoA hydratase n=1 Tax=Pseudomonas japonica TaxID=256466 RepID=A0A239LBW9_9PSED|nr:MaoC family dehydratase N-terminal domain-containing protein [Pseudomonas japonica]SNT27971.1 itaconyl-CoA hydratase / mesaconyl-C4 CoA hydratase [Pseudomonas japonica]
MNESPYAAWEGRTQTREECLSEVLVRRLAATLGTSAPATGQALAPLWHWAFFQDEAPADGLGEDGHPARGGFLPPAADRNRMWAGGRLTFHEPLRVGATVRRVSTIVGIEEKQGRSGALLFVTLRHEYLQDERLALHEEQDIVYREATPPKTGAGEALPAQQWSESIEPTAVLLFRYSAVTFNGHRIHYDLPYARDSEGYPGLVVHGPLLATLNLAAFRRAHPEARLRRFSFRSARPLLAPEALRVGGRIVAPGRAELQAGNAGGIGQHGVVEFD